MPIRYDIKTDLNSLYTSGGSYVHIGLGDLLDQLISGEVNGPGISTQYSIATWASTNGSDLLSTSNATIDPSGVLTLSSSNITHVLAGAIRIGDTVQLASVSGAGALRFSSGSLEYSDGTSWVAVNANAAEWHINGNAGTNSVTDYIGTSDAQDFVIRTNAIPRVTVDKAGPVTVDTSLTVNGDLTVNGTLTYINTTDIEVTDKNIIVNKNGNDASAIGAGLTVDRVSTQGSLIFDPSTTSKWKAGLLGSEYELLSKANTTSDLTEGSNLYFTDSRAVSATINGVNISDLADYFDSGIHVNVIYVNDNEKDIQTALTEVGASQGYSIYLSPGSFGGATVTVQDKINLQIIGPATPSGAHQCELAGGRALTISGATSTRVRLLNFQIEGLLTIDGTQGRHYFRDMDLVGGLTITNGTSNWLVFQNCYFSGPVTINASFAGFVYFIQCDFGNQTITNNAASAVQVVFNSCTGLNSFTAGNLTFSGQNFLYTGVSRLDMIGTGIFSGSDIAWSTDGGGNIGVPYSNSVTSIGKNRPINIYAKSNIFSTTYRSSIFSNQAAANNVFSFVKGRGTETSPLPTLANDYLGYLEWRATYNTALGQSLAITRIQSQALENIASGATGGRIVFQTCAIGTNTLSDTVYIAFSGASLNTNLFFPAETYDIGASSSNRPNNVYVKNNLEVGNDITLKGASGSDLLWSTDGGGNIGVSNSNRPDYVHIRTQLTIGTDTNLYRDSASTLKTDSNLVLGGGLSIKRSATSVDKTLGASDCYMGVDTTGGIVNITLPLANSTYSGKVYIVKDEAGNASVNKIRIQVQGSDKIDGGTYFDLITESESVTVVGDGASNWFLI
jgi:hypothetical protein